MWVLTAALLFIFYFAVHLIIIAIQKGRELRHHVSSSTYCDKEFLDRQIYSQRMGFSGLLTGLRILGILLPCLGLLSILSNLIQVFDGMVASGSWEVTLFASGISEILLGLATAVMLTALCWTVYLIFSFILQRRILHLQKLKLEIQPPHSTQT